MLIINCLIQYEIISTSKKIIFLKKKNNFKFTRTAKISLKFQLIQDWNWETTINFKEIDIFLFHIYFT